MTPAIAFGYPLLRSVLLSLRIFHAQTSKAKVSTKKRWNRLARKLIETAREAESRIIPCDELQPM